MSVLKKVIDNLKYNKRNRNIVLGVIALILIVSLGLVLYHYNVKIPREKAKAEQLLEEEQKKREAEAESRYVAILDNEDSVLKPQTKDGYTSYIVKYKTREGDTIDIENKFQFVKEGDETIVFTLEEAQASEIIGDYYDDNGDYYFQLKNGSNFVWYINPPDTTVITNWTPSKEDTTIALNPTDITNNRMVVETVIVDYESEDTPVLTYYEEMIEK